MGAGYRPLPARRRISAGKASMLGEILLFFKCETQNPYPSQSHRSVLVALHLFR